MGRARPAGASTDPETVATARAQFLRAPCIVAVLACPRAHPKIPRSEQVYSAGAVCMMLVTAARAYNIGVLDGVFNDIADLDGLGQECEHGTALGFDGKTLIHPNQIETANTLFAPTSEEISEAEHIINAFENPENAGKGVIQVNGKMTELLHLEQAKRVVAIASAIQEMET